VSEEKERTGFGMPRPSRSAESKPQKKADSENEPNSDAKADSDEPDSDTLADDDELDLASEFEKSGVEEVLKSLDTELVGLAPVKQRIREISALLLVDNARRKFGLSTSRPNLHMSFTGSPGTGKTTVALQMSELLHRLGYLRRGHLIAVTRDDLVGQYVGHTAPKTKDVLKKAMGGVLFIDEAYYLYRAENERDYGQESIEILLQVMENQREDIVVILAGYKDRMDSFFASNPGMSSRVAHHIDFPDFSVEELEEIGHLMVDKEGYAFAPETEKVFAQYVRRRKEQPRFANARSIRNAIERARLRHANRVLESSSPTTRDQLMRLEPEDFLGSRVFEETDSQPEHS